MRNTLLIALIGLCFAVQGKAKTTNVISFYPLETFQSEFQEAPSQELVERILRYASQELGIDYQCLCDQYDNGEILIDKTPPGYLVTIQTLSGGVGILIFVESL